MSQRLERFRLRLIRYNPTELLHLIGQNGSAKLFSAGLLLR